MSILRVPIVRGSVLPEPMPCVVHEREGSDLFKCNLTVYILLLFNKCTNVYTDMVIQLIYIVCVDLLKPTGHVMHQQFNIQQL